MESFFATVRQFTHLSPQGEAALRGVARRLDLPKGHVLIRAGTVCQYIYFLESGLSRTYYLKKGKEVRMNATENYFNLMAKPLGLPADGLYREHQSLPQTIS